MREWTLAPRPKNHVRGGFHTKAFLVASFTPGLYLRARHAYPTLYHNP